MAPPRSPSVRRLCIGNPALVGAPREEADEHKALLPWRPEGGMTRRATGNPPTTYVASPTPAAAVVPAAAADPSPTRWDRTTDGVRQPDSSPTPNPRARPSRSLAAAGAELRSDGELVGVVLPPHKRHQVYKLWSLISTSAMSDLSLLCKYVIGLSLDRVVAL